LTLLLHLPVFIECGLCLSFLYSWRRSSKWNSSQRPPRLWKERDRKDIDCSSVVTIVMKVWPDTILQCYQS